MSSIYNRLFISLWSLSNFKIVTSLAIETLLLVNIWIHIISEGRYSHLLYSGRHLPKYTKSIDLKLLFMAKHKVIHPRSEFVGVFGSKIHGFIITFIFAQLVLETITFCNEIFNLNFYPFLHVLYISDRFKL